MMARAASILALSLTLAGCCLTTQVTGQTAGAQGSGGSSSSTGSAAGPGTTGSTTAAASSTGGSSSGTTGGSSTGPTLAPILLLDAGEDVVFGPVSIVGGLNGPSSGGARLAYSMSDGGPFNVYLQGFSDEALPAGAPELIAGTSPGLFGAPGVSVSNYGNETALCWDDNGVSTDPFGGQACSTGIGPIVICATIAAQGAPPQNVFSDCGNSAQLIFNPADGVTQLLVYNGDFQLTEAFFPSAGDAITLNSSLPVVGVPVLSGLDEVFFGMPSSGMIPGCISQGLTVVRHLYGGSTLQPICSPVDASFDPDGQFAVAGNPTVELAGILELDGAGLRASVWGIDAGIATEPIPSAEAPTGPLAAGPCPNGFGYVTMTADGSLLFTEQAFDGTLMPDGGLLQLGRFSSAPITTSMAVAPSLDGGLFLAVSSPAQIGVYLISCE